MNWFRFVIFVSFFYSFWGNSKSYGQILDVAKLQDLIYQGNYDSAYSILSQYKEDTTMTPENRTLYLHLLASVLEKTSQSELGQYYRNQALQLAYQYKLNNWLAFLNHYFANNFFEKQQYDSAYIYANKSIYYSKYLKKRSFTTAQNYNLLTYIYYVRKEYGKAEQYAKKSLQLFELDENLCETPLVYTKLAKIYQALNEKQKAILAGQLALKISDSCQVNPYKLIVLEDLWNLYAYYGEYQNGFEAMLQAKKLQDSLKMHDQESNIVKLENLYRIKLQEAEKENLKIQNQKRQEVIYAQMIIMILAFIVIIIIAGFGYYLYKKRRQQTEYNRILMEQKDSIEKLNQLNRKIFSVISHDFKTPLVSVQILVDLIEQGELDPQKMRFYSKDIQNQINQTLLVIENLLNWAKVEINETVSLESVTNLSQIISFMIDEQQSQIQKKGLHILVSIPDTFQVNVNPEILKIIIRNLLHNAVKYSYWNGKIEFLIQNQELWIRDEGTGIPEKQQKMIFQSQVFSKPGTAQEMGFGLGLYMIHELIIKNQGFISFEPNLPTGCIFKIRFPIA